MIKAFEVDLHKGTTQLHRKHYPLIARSVGVPLSACLTSRTTEQRFALSVSSPRRAHIAVTALRRPDECTFRGKRRLLCAARAPPRAVGRLETPNQRRARTT
eukprot:1084517-Prymnesium_polylepis.2